MLFKQVELNIVVTTMWKNKQTKNDYYGTKNCSNNIFFYK